MSRAPGFSKLNILLEYTVPTTASLSLLYSLIRYNTYHDTDPKVTIDLRAVRPGGRSRRFFDQCSVKWGAKGALALGGNYLKEKLF